MTEPLALPPSEVDVTGDVIRALLSDQHPDLAHLPLGDRHDGWDNTTWRLGEDLAVRLPRRKVGAELGVTALDWLPRINAHWPFRAQVPVRIGAPGRGYPWRWSVVPWIHGVSSYRLPLNASGAAALGAALAALHQIAPAEAPRNPYRSTSLAGRMNTAEQRVGQVMRTGRTLGWELDVARLRQVLMTGARQPRRVLTWCHLDLHGDNVLSDAGGLAGIVDWGDAAAGDPATDLGQAMALVGLHHWDSLMAGYQYLEGPMLMRARAEAAYFGVTLASISAEHYATPGWRALRDLGLARRSG